MVSTATACSTLQGLVEDRVDPAARAWLAEALGLAGDAGPAGAFAAAFALAARRLGKAPLELDPVERARLAEAGLDWPVAGWGRDEAGRAVLLVRAAAARSGAAREALVDDLYRHGDNRERQAILRALALLPEPERFVPLAVEACRTSVQPVFEAIACENPFPARHFGEPSFNQMVLKAVFTGVALDRIVGLAGRRTPELGRMAADYASERRAAGRPVPADLELLQGGAR